MEAGVLAADAAAWMGDAAGVGSALEWHARGSRGYAVDRELWHWGY